MEAVYKLEATVTDNGNDVWCEIKSNGRMCEAGKAILLSNIMKALKINPDSVSDIALISVALEHCQDEKISYLRDMPINLC